MPATEQRGLALGLREVWGMQRCLLQSSGSKEIWEALHLALLLLLLPSTSLCCPARTLEAVRIGTRG